MKNFNYSWQKIAKASFIGIATTATFYLTKTTGLFSSWLSTAEALDSLSELKEIDTASINTAQRRLLQQGEVMIANPIPDQVIQVDQQYIYSLDNVFSGNYSLLGAVETGKNSLPSWLNLEPKLLSTFFSGTGITVHATAISGSTVFVAAQGSGLKILDVSNANNPRLLSSLPAGSGGSAFGVLINGSTVFVANGAAGLQIVNITNLNNPKLISTFPSQNGTAYDVAISGSTVFVADDNIGLQIIDASNISNPRLLAVFPAGTGYARGVAISGSIAFVADYTVGLQIIDISNTTNPQLISTFAAVAWSVAISGNTVYVANIFNLQILDVSNMSNPRLIFSGLSGQKVAIVGNALFVSDGLQIFDVTNTSNPRLLSELKLGAVGASDIKVNGNMAFLAVGNSGLQIFNLSQGIFMGVPPISEVGKQISITASAWNMSMELIGNRFSLTLDQLPRVVTSTIADQSIYPGQSISLFLSSTLLFTNPGNSFLKLTIKLNKGTPALKWLNLNLQPTLVSTMFQGSGQQVHDVAINGTTAFVTNNILKILDVSQPNNPRLLSTVSPGGSGIAWQTAIDGNTAFVAWTISGLKIIDVSNTSNPRLLSTYPLGNAYGIALSPGTAFVADYFVGLQIIDISNMSNPRLISTYSFGSGYTIAVAISGRMAFVSVANVGLKILDVSNTSNPRLLSSFPSAIQSATISGDTVFVAAFNGLQIFDVTNASNPRLLSFYSTQEAHTTHVKIVGSTAFVAASDSGLQIFDVSNTSDPHLLGSHPGAGGQAYSTAVTGNMAFLADYNGGLLILDISQWMLSVAPNDTDVGNYELQLVATDELGGTATTEPFTIRVEGAPQFHGNISTQFAKVGQTFNYFIPQGLVADPNFDAMVFTAKLISGQELPSWLSFNAVSATFAGTPPSSAVGNATILLSVTDNIAGSVNTTFLLQVSHAPTVNQRIADQAMGIGRNNSFLLPPGTFTHADNLPLVYSAKRSNGLSLPAWLMFNTIGAIFIGQPNATDVSIVSVQVTADDQAGGQASTQFNLRIENFPRINQPILAQSAGVGVPYRFSVLNSFVDDDGDTMTYQTSQLDGSSLPSWLSFNAFGLEFSGTPASSDLETFAIRFSATDNWGGRTDQVFNMTVTYFPTVGTPVYPQVSCVDQPYQFVVPSNTFLAGGAGFTYAARQSNGQSLPLWLSLDGISGTFSGIPAASDVDQITLTLIGNANNGGMASTDFTLTTTTCPSLRNPVASRVTNVNTPFALTLAGDTFDNGGMTLTLSAERSDHSALPNWLSFNPVSGVLAGVPLSSDVKIDSLQIVARNPLGGQAVAPFNLSVCYFPTLTTALPTIPFLRAQRAFTFKVPSGTFISQTGALLQYQAQRADGSALPSWLAFNATQQQLFGTPGLTDLGNFNLQIIASDPSCGSTPAPLPLVVQQNYPPEVVHPLTNQVAAVGTRFTFFAPSDTFTDRNSDPLNYTAAQSNGQSLPGWLHFTANTLSFSGTPGRGDTDAFSDKVLAIALTAHDDKSQASANFNINVQGTSNVLLFIKIAAPIFSVLTTALALYSQRGRILNHCKPQRYQRLEDYTVTVGESFEYKFATPSEQIIKVRARIAKENKGCCRLFQVPRQALPGGTDLPLWMEYNPETNTLRTIGPVPKTKLTELFVQAKGSAERTLEQFTLRIVQPELSQEVEATEQRNLSSEPNAPTSSGSGDVEMQTLQSTAPRVSF